MDIQKRLIFLSFLRRLSLLEGVSTLILFLIAMPMKYLLDVPEAVTWPGRVHGGLFVLLVIFAIVAIKLVPISKLLAAKILMAALIPFGPFWMDGKLKILLNGMRKHP